MELIIEIEEKIKKCMKPHYFKVEDESSMHKTPAGTVSHLRIVIVSDVFAGMSLVEQHQLVYKELSTFLKSGLKAIGLTTKTPEIWQKEKDLNKSPDCLGRS